MWKEVEIELWITWNKQKLSINKKTYIALSMTIMTSKTEL